MHSLSSLNGTFIVSVSVEQESECCLAGFSAGVSEGSNQGESQAVFSSGGWTEEELASERHQAAGRIPFCAAIWRGLWFLTGWGLPTWASPTRQLAGHASKEALQC